MTRIICFDLKEIHMRAEISGLKMPKYSDDKKTACAAGRLNLNWEQILHFRKWFKSYVSRFYSGDPEIQKNFSLKEDHTWRVAREIHEIAASLSLPEEEICLAGITALFHDIGRFEQFALYRTFSDWKSENHAVLGIRILREERVLGELDPNLQKLIQAVIFWHNRAAPPQKGEDRMKLLSRLLRDADKLDIWRVITAAYKRRDGSRNLALEHNLPDDPRITPSVLEEVISGKPVSISLIKTRNDFKLLHLSWIFDINFAHTFRIIRERNYLEIIRDSLPDTGEVGRAYDAAAYHAQAGVSKPPAPAIRESLLRISS